MAPPTKHPTDVILDAARTLVLRDGPRAASVAAIAKESGAPVGTLYHRFGNRDGVLAALWLRAIERFHTHVMEGVAAEPDPVERALAIVRGSIEFGRRRTDDARLLLAVRRADLLDAEPTAEFDTRLNEMNAPVFAALGAIAQGLHGQRDPRAIEAVTRAVVDLPYAAIRRHPELPDWLAEDLLAAARVLLQAQRR